MTYLKKNQNDKNIGQALKFNSNKDCRGDGRWKNFENTIAIRAVNSVDGMTAN